MDCAISFGMAGFQDPYKKHADGDHKRWLDFGDATRTTTAGRISGASRPTRSTWTGSRFECSSAKYCTIFA